MASPAAAAAPAEYTSAKSVDVRYTQLFINGEFVDSVAGGTLVDIAVEDTPAASQKLTSGGYC